MKVTAICKGAFMGGPAYTPGKQMTMSERKAKANLSTFAFVAGHHDITPAAAQTVRDHYQETGDRIDIGSLEGTGADGRILVEDVEAAIEPEGDETEHEDEGGEVIRETITESATFSDEE